jgi:excisionase family DNA binding protein
MSKPRLQYYTSPYKGKPTWQRLNKGRQNAVEENKQMMARTNAADLVRATQLETGDFVTTKEAAELVRVSHWTISAWLFQHKLKRYKVGGRTLIRREDLQNMVR